MRMVTQTMAALGFVGTLAVGTAAPSLAQGVYFQGPGIEFGIGRPWYGQRYDRYYYDYNGPYTYYGQPYYDRPYRSERRYYRPQRWNWD